LNNKIEFPGYLLAEDLYFATAYISCCQGIQLIDNVVYNYNVRDGEEKSVSLTLTLDFYQRMVNGFLYIENYLLKTNKKELISPTLSSHVLYYLITINYSKDIPKSEREKLFKELERLMIYFDSK